MFGSALVQQILPTLYPLSGTQINKIIEAKVFEQIVVNAG
jgi:hypothetical protein